MHNMLLICSVKCRTSQYSCGFVSPAETALLCFASLAFSAMHVPAGCPVCLL